MPDVNFIGEISYAVSDLSGLSITFAIVPGNHDWSLRNGINFGESHSAVCSETTGVAVLSHPIDTHYRVSNAEGWPVFVFELWDRTYDEMKGFYGCGAIWLPCKPGKHCIDIPVWRNYPSNMLQRLRDHILPSQCNLTRIRELTMSPYMKQQCTCEQVGLLQINLYVAVSNNFEENGVLFEETFHEQGIL